MSIGKFIRATREARGLSRAQLSKVCAERGSRVHPNAIFRLETGRGDPQQSTIEAVMNGLGLRMELRDRSNLEVGVMRRMRGQ
jgi:transcriptional regulator with XRE-family HTH domain